MSYLLKGHPMQGLSALRSPRLYELGDTFLNAWLLAWSLDGLVTAAHGKS
jgi:hypothetical protein